MDLDPKNNPQLLLHFVNEGQTCWRSTKIRAASASSAPTGPPGSVLSRRTAGGIVIADLWGGRPKSQKVIKNLKKSKFPNVFCFCSSVFGDAPCMSLTSVRAPNEPLLPPRACATRCTIPLEELLPPTPMGGGFEARLRQRKNPPTKT